MSTRSTSAQGQGLATTGDGAGGASVPVAKNPTGAIGWLSSLAVVKWTNRESGCLKGFLDITAEPLRINGLKLFEKDGRRWVAWPAQEYVKRDGSKAYTPIVEFATRDDERAFQEVILADLGRYLEEAGDDA